MSGVLEKTFGGLVQNIFGSSGAQTQSGTNNVTVPGLKYVSLGLVHFVEKLQAARRISKQEEEYCVQHESREWVKLLSSPSSGSALVSDLLCRAMVIKVRGYSLPSLHIHAIKLTQSSNLHHKKLGYLFVSQELNPGSELSLLMVNTIQRDLAAANVLQVASALATLPTIVTVDLAPALTQALTTCLTSRQIYIRRRAVLMVGMLVSRVGCEMQEWAREVTPHFQHLLVDQDPGVAMAAINTLAKIYSVCSSDREELRTQAGVSASHVLVQTLNGSLPKDYQVNALPAPFVQISMLRVIRTISSRTWEVPSEVISAVESVVSQPWGGKEISLYAVLLECCLTITALPHNDQLISNTLKLVLGFLKSNNCDLKYVGLKALSHVFRVLESALTSSHLEAVLDCLYHSSPHLQAKTLHLLCAMANQHNYQAICTTLLEFSQRSSDSNLQRDIISELSSIVIAQCNDASWCVSLLAPMLLSSINVDHKITAALRNVIEKEFIAGNNGGGAIEASQELLLKIFSQEYLPPEHVTLIAAIINMHYKFDPKSVSKYFTDTIVERLKLWKCKTSDDPSVLECLKNIGLYDHTVNTDVIDIIRTIVSNSNLDVTTREAGREILVWLDHLQLSQKVINKQNNILSGKLKTDLTLSFLDGYVVSVLENDGLPYKSFSNVCSGETVSTAAMQHSTPTTTSNDSEDARSSTISVSTVGTAPGASYATSLLMHRSISSSSSRGAVWSAEGRIRQSSVGEGSTLSQTEPLPGQAAQYSLVIDKEGSPGIIEVADEAQEEEEGEVGEGDTSQDSSCPVSAQQRSQLTHALLLGLGMTRTNFIL
ncbi:unnamed protein product [Meganyctiphanes norvegica]|uniref:Clathrin/coatomer adaptor adaptin-like N-terminal domain-containing protein n=1 Tax=Meganyctiphanes norvegica TaxID=48144 RepID=A0AAV2R6F3_MEGNR